MGVFVQLSGFNADNVQTGNTGALELWSGQMWRRHGWRRKQAHGTENNLFIKGWDAGCGGKLCSRSVETEWGLLGWLPAPHHCQGSMMVASPRKFRRREYVVSLRERAGLGHMLMPGTWELLCVPRSKFTTAGWGSG